MPKTNNTNAKTPKNLFILVDEAGRSIDSNESKAGILRDNGKLLAGERILKYVLAEEKTTTKAVKTPTKAVKTPTKTPTKTKTKTKTKTVNVFADASAN